LHLEFHIVPTWLTCFDLDHVIEFNVVITSICTLNINEWHIGNYLSHLLKLMKPNLPNHNLFNLVIKLCDVIQWQNPKSMLGCKLSNSFLNQFPFCSNIFIFQVFSNLLYLHLFIFSMSIWTTWMLQLPSQLWWFGKIKPTNLLFNPWPPYKWFPFIAIFHVKCCSLSTMQS